jgi:hypothetical protein
MTTSSAAVYYYHLELVLELEEDNEHPPSKLQKKFLKRMTTSSMATCRRPFILGK